MREVTGVAILVAAIVSSATSDAAAAASAVAQRRQDAVGCTIDLAEDIADKEPLILHKKCNGKICAWKLPEGDEEKLHIQVGEEILVACPNKNNKLESLPSRSKSVVATCSGKQDAGFQVENREYSVKDLACVHTSKGEILNKNQTCGPRNAILLELGFRIREQWYSLIEVCYVKSRSGTLYTQHVLQGESMNKRRRGNRPKFEEDDVYYNGFSANTAYKNAQKTLQTVTGYSKSTFPSSLSTTIDRGHLSPDADFLLSSYRYTTYFYVNTLPMWGLVNRGNWAKLEEKLRKFAKNTGIDLRIATGGFRVMELTDITGHTKEFFLYTTTSRKQMPVPKYIWKVAYDEKSKGGIGFVVLNDPFRKIVDSSDQLCPNICKESRWSDKSWELISKGYLICCEVKELKKFISYVPKYEVKSILIAQS